MSTASDRREDSLALINSEFDRRAEFQTNAIRAVETKATFLIGATAVAMQVLLGLDQQAVLGALTYVALGCSVAAGLVAIWPIRFVTEVTETAPVIADYESWVKQGVENVKEMLLAKLVGAKQAAIASNADRFNMKVRSWRASLVAFGTGLILAIVSVVGAQSGTGPDRHHCAGGTHGARGTIACAHRGGPGMDRHRDPYS